MADQQGLRLTKPGVNAYHAVVTDDGAIPGQFHPDPKLATPVGEGHAISLEDAKKYDKDKNIPLELVEMSTRAANKAEKALAAELNTEAPSGAGGSN